MKMNKEDFTKNKWDYLETLVDKTNEVFKVPKRTNYLDNDNSDSYVSKKQSQKRIYLIFFCLALLQNIILVYLIALHSELAQKNQIKMIFHDYAGKVLFRYRPGQPNWDF